MTIQERLTTAMADSMRAKNSDRTNVLRLLRGAMKNEEIKIGHALSEDEALKVLQREAKQRRDSIEQYGAAGRTDLATNEQMELDVVLEYLPQPLSEEELRTVIDGVIEQQGAVDIKQMGSVVGGVLQRVGARAEGSVVSRLVKERLTQ